MTTLSVQQVGSSTTSRDESMSNASHPTLLGLDDFDNYIFDFDSTVIKSESLEIMLSELLADDPQKSEKMAQIEEWTNKGMNGEISFKEGLEARLRICSPQKEDLDKFCVKFCPSDFSDGMVDLVKDLISANKKVFILSGGFTDLILPFARYLGVPDDHVHAVEINWDPGSGEFLSLNESNGFTSSKIEGAMRLKHMFPGTTLGVGDGYTDYMLYSEGLATDFIAYIEHAAREKVIKVAPRCAKNVPDLRQKIGMSS